MLNSNFKENKTNFNTGKALKLFYCSVVLVFATFLVVGFLILSLSFGSWHSAFASVFGFVQTDWSGGASTTALAVHPGDQSGWTYYNSASSSISAGTELVLTPSTGSSVQTTDTDFNAGSFSSTAVSGTGNDASVILTATSSSEILALWKMDDGPDSTFLTDSSQYSNTVPINNLINILDNMDDASSWAPTNATLTQNTSNYKEGTGAINIIKTDTSVTGLYIRKDTGTPDLRNKTVGYWLYIKDATTLAKIRSLTIFLWSNNYATYYSGWKVSTSGIAQGWNFIIIDTSQTPDYTNGTPADLGSVFRIRLDIGVNNATDTFAEGDIVVDYYQSNGWTTGKLNGSFNFDGTNESASTTMSDITDSTFSYSFWENTTVAMGGTPFAEDTSGATACYTTNGVISGILVSPNAATEIAVGTNGVSVSEHSGSHAPIVASYQATLSGWNHIALVSYSPTDMRLFVNGVERDIALNTTLTRGLQVRSVGAKTSCWFHFFNGRIDDLGIYNRALSPEEVANIYNNGVGREAVGVYYSPGTFTSSVADLGQTAAFTTLNYTISTSASVTLTVDIRAGNTAVPDGTWTAWQTNIADGGDISALDGNRYVQYRANFSTTDTSITPFLNDVTVNYQSYPASRSLISSPYDTSDDVAAISQISWTENLPAGTDIKFQMRTAPDSSGPWTDWLGPSGTSDYYTDPSGGETINPAHSDGTNDRWIQYRVFLEGGLYTPTLSDVNLSYTFSTPASSSDSVTVTQSVVAGISINSPADVVMNQLSITQNTSVGTTTWKIITNSQGGYVLSVKASASPAMTDSSTGESFSDYATSSPSTWGVNNDYQFGFAPLGNDTSGYGTGNLCESSNNVPSATLGYTGFYTADRTIASSSSETSVSGTETTVCYATGQETKLAPSGAYTAVITATATTQ